MPVCIMCIMFAHTTMTFAQQHSETGTFDINKVASAVNSGSPSVAPESAKAPGEVAGLPVAMHENWTLVCLRIGLYLALTIGAVFLVLLAMKRVGVAGRSKIGGGSMDVLEALPLGQNKNVALVRIVDKVYVIGQTQTQITVLDIIDGQKAIELISTTKGVVSISQFKDVFNSFMGKLKK